MKFQKCTFSILFLWEICLWWLLPVPPAMHWSFPSLFQYLLLSLLVQLTDQDLIDKTKKQLSDTKKMTAHRSGKGVVKFDSQRIMQSPAHKHSRTQTHTHQHPHTYAHNTHTHTPHIHTQLHWKITISLPSANLMNSFKQSAIIARFVV